MKKQRKASLPAIGGSSLLVIFSVLCLTLLSLLGLNTVLAEKRLSEASAQVTIQWYEADLEAQEIFARLRAGEEVPGVEREETIYRYEVPITDRQTLLVVLQENDGTWEILSWYARAHTEESNETLPVWQGQE